MDDKQVLLSDLKKGLNQTYGNNRTYLLQETNGW